jgi:signal transduction histidine kinase
MDNDVTIVVDAKNRTAEAFGSAAKGAKTVGDVAERAAKQVRDMGDKLDTAQNRARQLAQAEERAAEKTRRMAQDLALLRHELEQNGDETGTLSRKIERLGVDTRFAAEATEEYRRQANKAAADAREQARAYDRVADNARQAARAVTLLGVSTKLGVKAGGNLLSEISSGFLKGGIGGASGALEGTLGTPVLGPALLAGGAAAAIPAASFLGGAAGGGVLAGLGAAGAGAGLAGAWAGNPDKYAKEWESAADRFKTRWIASSAAFGNELDGVLKTAGQTLDRLPVEKVLALSQSFIAPLAAGAGQGVAGFANGFADALERVQPVVDELGPQLANLGNDLGDTLRIISQGSEGGAHALGDLVDFLGYAAKATGLLILGFEKAYEVERKFWSGIADSIGSTPLGSAMEDFGGWLTYIGSTSTVTARSLDDVGDATKGAASSWADWVSESADAVVQAHELNDALTQLRNTQLAAADANVALAQGWLDLTKSLSEGEKSLDLNKQAGIDNQKALLDQAAAAERAREKQIELTGDIGAADATYAANIERIRQMAYAAGFNKQKVDELIASIYAVPQTVETKVLTPGMDESLQKGISLGNALNNIDGHHYTATVDVRYQSYNPGIALGNLLHHAAGGPTSSGYSAVNDWGSAGVGEIMRLPNGSTVIPAGTGRRMMRDLATTGTGTGRPTETAVRVHVSGSGALYEALMHAQQSGEFQIFSSAIVD